MCSYVKKKKKTIKRTYTQKKIKSTSTTHNQNVQIKVNIHFSCPVFQKSLLQKTRNLWTVQVSAWLRLLSFLLDLTLPKRKHRYNR